MASKRSASNITEEQLDRWLQSSVEERLHWLEEARDFVRKTLSSETLDMACQLRESSQDLHIRE